jgi:NAD(P)H-hydrate epimerase
MQYDLPKLLPRAPSSHKGDYGRALLVGGSRGMAGAIALSGMAALRSGAGLVTIATADSAADVVAGFHPSYMTVALPQEPTGTISDSAKEPLSELVSKANCVAIGPGMGVSRAIQRLVAWLYDSLPAPIVVDADGLNALAERPSGLQRPAGARILTPHPGEFRRLAGNTDLNAAAILLARKCQVVVVLKGHRTLITDGNRTLHNPTGNPGMATGGSGDVLTGVITALVCQGLPPFEAAQLGAYVHGFAGDLAAAELGEVGMTSRDLIDYLPRAFLQLREDRSEVPATQ